MKKILLSVFIFALALVAGRAVADEVDSNDNDNYPGSKVSVSINNNGKVDIGGAKITAINNASTTLTVYTGWGTAGQTYTVDISQASLTRRYNYGATLAEISVGDFISFTGTIDKSVAGLVVKADKVKDHSIQRHIPEHDGTVTAKSGSSLTVTLKNSSQSTIVMTTATTTIQKNGATSSLSDIVVGSRLTIFGLLNNVQNTLNATSIKINASAANKPAKNYQGTLKSIATSTTEALLVITVDGSDKSVHVPNSALIYNKKFKVVSLSAYKVGDTIRFFGSFRAGDTVHADASIVRDINI